MLTDRQLFILQIIIDDFIRSAQPVGSRNLAKKDDVSYSPATIRNEMADLEEMGFLEKTHTSSGRVPSEKGYRYYVDHMLSPGSIRRSERTAIHSIFADRQEGMEKAVQNAATILSELTSYTSIVLGPKFNDHKVKNLQIIPIDRTSAVAIIVTDTGHVENRLFSLPDGIEPADIEKMVNILNDRLTGVPLSELRRKIFQETAQLMKRHLHNYEAVLNMFAEASGGQPIGKLFIGGKTNIFNQPEFRDIEKVRLVMDMMEKEHDMYELVRPTESGIQVKIGTENAEQAMEDCSLITASYSVGNEPVGTIAILGPKRMEYSRVITLVDFLSHDMTNVLTRLYNTRS
ncbi:heat-inducible transcriptional repressor HrcA [Domibacillus enclensis]|uniref:Heat-inducible transcription repressor HrcA n=1 Tax=Domibacillus enclensis TaxID=1017273 RepID=A0A1N6PRI6_9BACI|nr:heat-inducible transcriptional repressor HrcA [Domibacillus enclensis]OXS80457.1 heat-inducible transcriptional repressor HrcA [Domibacillus enclensis]SIQ06852.1 heat-inducible transcription repressor HrcA [Domibacillus enclensis]